MAFPFHHRKLLNDSILDLGLVCERSCEIIFNSNGTCLPPCLTICLAVCPPCPPPPSPPPPSPPPPSSPPPLSPILITSLAVLSTAFFLFFCYTVYKFYIITSRRRRPEQEDGGGDDEEQLAVVDHPIWYIRTIGLQPYEINAITIVKYRKGDGLVEGTDCAVCLNEFEEDETLRLLPNCNHAFHIPCIDTWLGSHTNCPMCRAGIVIPVAGDVHTESVGFVSEVDRSQSVVEVNDDGFQPVRRSVSMDSLSASVISAAIANAFPQRSERNQESKRVGENEMQTGGSSSIKRSVSCNAKVFLSRHSSRSRI